MNSRVDPLAKQKVLAGLIEEDIGNSTDEGANLDVVKFDKVQPTLGSLWYDPVAASERVGLTYDDGFEDEENNNYDEESDIFEQEDNSDGGGEGMPVEEVKSTHHSQEPYPSEKKTFEKASVRPKPSSPSKIKNSSTKPTKNPTNNVQFVEPEDEEVVFEEAIASEYGSRQSRRSVEKLMSLSETFGKNESSASTPPPNGKQVRNDSQSNVSLLEAEGRPVSTPSLYFVDNALSAGLWSDTPKIKWEQKTSEGKSSKK